MCQLTELAYRFELRMATAAALEEGLKNHQATHSKSYVKINLRGNIYITFQGKLVTDQALQTKWPSKRNPKVTKRTGMCLLA